MTQNEQILGILTGTLYRNYVSTGKKSMADVMVEIGKSLSITLADVERYVVKNGLPREIAPFNEPSLEDGFYCVKQSEGKLKGKYAIYGQERGAPYNVTLVDTEEQAAQAIARRIAGDYFIRDFKQDWTNDRSILDSLWLDTKNS